MSDNGSRRPRNTNPDRDRLVRQNSVLNSDPLNPADSENDGRIGPSYSIEGEFTSTGILPRDERSNAAAIADEIINDEESARGLSEDEFLFRIVNNSPGPAPHYFAEQNHNIYHLSTVVYIQGVDVSRWLVGNMSYNEGINDNPTTVTFTLDNTFNRFTLTPENFSNQWRLAKDEKYSEWEKKQIYDFKSQSNVNPADTLSGGLRFPLEHYGSIFHFMDPIRIWIRNPAAGYEADEWIPKFTGYIVSKSRTSEYIDSSSTISIVAQDIRMRMSKMRVNDNTVLAILPGEAITSAASPFDSSFFGPVNVQEDRGFFKDLTVSSSRYENPWVNLNLPQLIQALTFAENAQDVINEANSPRDIEQLRNRKNELENELSRLPPGSDEALSVQSQLSAVNSRLNTYDRDVSQNRADRARSEGRSGNTRDRALSVESIQLREGGSRLGGMTRGLFPSSSESTRLPEDTQDRRNFLEDWYSLCFFGTPVREILDNEGRTGNLVLGRANHRYWTLSEVRSAGALTKTDHAWRPDAQMVHLIEPSSGSPGDPIFRNVSVLKSSLSNSRNWTNRLQLLVDACETIDYRFWVTGCGDLVFEFPQYDFLPSDYGSWSGVLTIDGHLLHDSFDNETKNMTTVVVATGSFTGLANIPNPTSAELFAPSKLAVGVWSAALVARHGINVEVVSFPQISTTEDGLGRLRQLATLHFQKLLALADRYDADIIFRPWLLPNKPVFFKRAARYALIDEIQNSVPVNTGNLGGGNPSTSLSLTYSRGIDPFGIPRYITGGPSQAVFFGQREGTSVVTQIERRARIIAESIDRFNRGEALTTRAFAELREELGGFLPLGNDVFNVIDVPLNIEDIESGAIEGDIQSVQQSIFSAQNAIRETLANPNLTESDALEQVNRLRGVLISLADRLEQLGVDSIPLVDGSVGTLPWHGGSGVRDTEYIPPSDRSRDVSQPDELGGCVLDNYRFSSPLGKAQSSVYRRLVRTSSQQETRSLTGDTDPQEEVQPSGRFPRNILKVNDQSNFAIFPVGTGERVYAIADGIVREVDFDSNRIVIDHNDGFVSLYNGISPEVSERQEVKRNEIVGSTTSFGVNEYGCPVLEFRLGTYTGDSSRLNEDEVIGYIKGKYSESRLPLTGRDALWLARSCIGEEYAASRAGNLGDRAARARAIIICYLQRMAYLNDARLRSRPQKSPLTLYEHVVGNPGSSGHSQPVAVQWVGRGDPSLVQRREIIRSLEWENIDPNLRNMIIGFFRGDEPLQLPEPGIIDFADESTTQSALERRASESQWQRFQFPPSRNWFMSNKASRDSERGSTPWVTITPSDGLDLVANWYNPTNGPSERMPGVPNRLYETPRDTSGSPPQGKAVVIGDSYTEPAGYVFNMYSRIADALGFGDGLIPVGVRSTGLLESRGNKSWLNSPLRESIVERIDEADLVLVHLGNNDPQHSPELIERFNQLLLDANAGRVIWLAPTYRPDGNQNIARRALSMRAALNSASVISVPGLNETPRRDLSNDLVHLNPSSNGPNRWGDRTIEGLRPFFNTQESRDSDITRRTISTEWNEAIPPEECPPDRQRRLQQPESRSRYE